MENLIVDRIKKHLSSPFEILSERDFRFLWLGEFCSLLGDQFYWISLPWLVLKLTGNPLILGSLLAVQMVPRSIFMLIGGALTDRFSPQNVMLTSVCMRLILVAALTFLVFTGLIHIWILYLLVLLFGLVDGFFFPAQNSMVPTLLDQRKLQTGNALIQGTAQFSMFLGPMMAGVLIAWLNGPEQVIRSGHVVEDLRGIGITFGVDLLGYFLAVLFLLKIKLPPDVSAAQKKGKKENVLESIRSGLDYAWQNEDLRFFFLLVASMAFVVNGTIVVGVPVLADTRFEQGAAAFGIIMSSFGGGSLLGILLASTLPAPPARWVGRILLLVVSTLGIGLILLAFTRMILIASLIALTTGIGGGYILITVITWLQKRAPQAMLGRTMSLLTFSTLGLNPFAMALAGALSKWSVTNLLAGSGVLLSLIALITLFSPAAQLMES